MPFRERRYRVQGVGYWVEYRPERRAVGWVGGRKAGQLRLGGIG